MQFVDLRGIRIDSTKPQPLDAFVIQSFDAVIGNFGNATASPYIYLFIDGFRVAHGNLPLLPAGSAMEVGFGNLVFRTSGVVSFEIRVRERFLQDMNLIHNTMRRNFTIQPDGCGLWSRRLIGNTRNISFSVNDPRIDTNLVRAATDDWNGISSNVNFSTVGVNLSNPTASIATEVLPSMYGGRFIPNTISGNFTGGVIQVNRYNWEHGIPHVVHVTVMRDIVLRHEIGHLLGLHHPVDAHDPEVTANIHCRYPAVMHDMNRMLCSVSPRVTNHDMRALINQHGP